MPFKKSIKELPYTLRQTSAPLVTNETRLEFFERTLSEHRDKDECLLWPVNTTANFYGKIWVPELRKCVWVHRLSFFYKHGRWPMPEALHSCDVRNCYAWAHLSEGTHRQNIHDTISHGNRYQPNVQGAQNGRCKLTDADVIAIRREYLPGKGGTGRFRGNCKILAARFGVHDSLIRRIVRYKTWKHLL